MNVVVKAGSKPTETPLEFKMIKQSCKTLLLLLIMAPAVLADSSVRGKLDYLSLPAGIVEVNGRTFDVETENTRIIYNGRTISEEDIQPGDEVVLHFDEGSKSRKKKSLKQITLLTVSKPGFES